MNARAAIQAHIDAGTCHVCGATVDFAQGYNGATGAHWDCSKKLQIDVETSMSRMDAALAKLSGKMPRAAEGQGATAKKALALGVAAVEAALKTTLRDVRQWNQQGPYRGPKWDLDAWGMNFTFDSDGHTFAGSASSLATMSACVKAGGLRAVPADVANTFSLDMCGTQDSSRKPVVESTRAARLPRINWNHRT